MDDKEDLVGKGRKIKKSRSVILLNSLHKYVPGIINIMKGPSFVKETGSS